MRRQTLTSALVLGTMAILLTGCGRNPTAPEVMSPSQPGASAGSNSEEHDPTTGPDGGDPGVTSTLSVEANGAGTVRVGRFTLTLHKNSLPIPCTITLSVEHPAAMSVQVQVSPPEANAFQVPLELLADLSDRPDMNLDEETMFWWQDGWLEADNVTVQMGSHTVKARTQNLRNAKLGKKQTYGHGREKN